MKKLMIAAAIVCAAALSQAASLNWGVGSIAATPDGTGKAKDNLAYFMPGSTYTEFLALAPDKVVDYVAKFNTYTAKTTTNRSGDASVSATSGTYNVGDEISGYVVVLDAPTTDAAKWYVASDKFDVKVPGSGNAGIVQNFTDTAGWKSTSAAPEPTSGLLLLLGVAGLALKRKRA